MLDQGSVLVGNDIGVKVNLGEVAVQAQRYSMRIR
jgi:hypothetical protein